MRSITRHFSTIKTKPIISFILGGPCCGKGTQSKLIEQHLGYKHLSAGELLREQRKNSKSEYSQLIEQTVISGKIVPSYITVSLLKKAIENNKHGYKKFLIDGFPRNLQNYNTWYHQMKQETVTDLVISLVCSNNTMIERLKSRAKFSDRSDDNVQTIKKRLVTFQQQTLPVLSRFKQNNKVLEIDAEKNPNQIFSEISQKILKLQIKDIK